MGRATSAGGRSRATVLNSTTGPRASREDWVREVDGSIRCLPLTNNVVVQQYIRAPREAAVGPTIFVWFRSAVTAEVTVTVHVCVVDPPRTNRTTRSTARASALRRSRDIVRHVGVKRPETRRRLRLPQRGRQQKPVPPHISRLGGAHERGRMRRELDHMLPIILRVDNGAPHGAPELAATNSKTVRKRRG